MWINKWKTWFLALVSLTRVKGRRVRKREANMLTRSSVSWTSFGEQCPKSKTVTLESPKGDQLFRKMASTNLCKNEYRRKSEKYAKRLPNKCQNRYPNHWVLIFCARLFYFENHCFPVGINRILTIGRAQEANNIEQINAKMMLKQIIQKWHLDIAKMDARWNPKCIQTDPKEPNNITPP